MKDKDLKKKLSAQEYAVLREGDTEAPFSGKYLKNNKKGVYACKVCGNVLFSSDSKFDSGSGWPSFYNMAKTGTVEFKEDHSLGTPRTEVICSKCKSHLGHVFPDGPADKTGKRYCINSVCLDFKPGENKA